MDPLQNVHCAGPCLVSGVCDLVSSAGAAVQVATYKSKIDETTRKMMALVSELSMQQVHNVCMCVCTCVLYVCV